MPISAERWRLLSPLLDEALDLPIGERPGWLASLQVRDAALALEMAWLLDQHETLAHDGFLAATASPPQPQATLAGLVVGSYTLRSIIGQGGYGTVWLAGRSDGRFEGVAAVKLLNASLIGRTGETRFKREGNLLARLSHPHIAHLIDAGVSSTGQPYLVLEHVEGEHIDRYCDDRLLDLEQRIRLFLDVLSAVSFAHASLIVHRDLKPSNVLVTGSGQVKLLDFGIAKLIESESGASGATALTREGGAALTPEYAAPEQLTAGQITTTTDVYALGVMLYVLLTGQHPAGPGMKSPADLMKSVVEEPAPRPSDVVGATGRLAETALGQLASQRTSSPVKLGRILKGDLDNIVAKALRKQPTERYPSAEAFADDLRRYLNHQPVGARADSLAYRTAKFVRRNRAGVAAAGLAMAAVLAGTIGVAWQAREARIQRDAAQAQLARATATSEFMSFLLSVAAPGGQKFSVSELLNQGEALIDKQFADDDALRAEMLAALGYQYLTSERWDRARAVLERAVDLSKESDDAALRARAMCPLALLRMMHGSLDQANELMSSALAGLTDDPRYALQRAECLTRFSEFSFFTSDADSMIRNAAAAIELLDSVSIPSRPRHVDAQAALGYGYYLARRNKEADQTFAQVMTGLEQLGKGRTVAAADVLNNWSLVHYLGDITRAEQLIRRTVELRRSIEGTGSVVPTATHNHAGVLLRLARYAEAEALFEETIRTARDRHEERIELDAMMELAELHVERGDLVRAASQLSKLDALKDRRLFEGHRKALLSYYRGRLSQAQGDLISARDSLVAAIAFFDSRKAKIGVNVLALIHLSRAQSALGEAESAGSTARQAIELAESFVEKDAPSYLVGLSLAAFADTSLAGGRTAEAGDAYQKALAHLEQTLGPDHPATTSAREKAALQTTRSSR